MTGPLIVFDMDGVLVDVSESYREAIARTAEWFTGAAISREKIQQYKNEGGFNDDWKLTHHIVQQAGINASLEAVKAQFQQLFLGTHNDGLILRERWIAQSGVLERLSKRYRFALFTGRPAAEVTVTLERFAPALVFDPIVAMEHVENRKPAPDGLLGILRGETEGKVFYVGDTVDDARCARAAGVPFIGIAGPENPLYLDLVFLFQDEHAYAIIDNINYLEEVLE